MRVMCWTAAEGDEQDKAKIATEEGRSEKIEEKTPETRVRMEHMI